jgi:hypothetical protein
MISLNPKSVSIRGEINGFITDNLVQIREYPW